MVRRAEAAARRAGEAENDVAALGSTADAIKALASKLADEKAALIKAGDVEERLKLESEKAELEDRTILSANAAKLTTRRDLMVTDAAYVKALALFAKIGRATRLNSSHYCASR